jgi:hypothetical protein
MTIYIVNNDDTCIICAEKLNNDKHKLDCGHDCFHTKCIINWFRSSASNGTCPYCRSTEQDFHVYRFDIINSAGYAKREARKKSCTNKYLKEEYKKYQKIVEKQKKNALETRNFKKSNNNICNNEILKKNRELIKEKFNLKRQLYKSERCLANFIQSGIHIVKK